MIKYLIGWPWNTSYVLFSSRIIRFLKEYVCIPLSSVSIMWYAKRALIPGYGSAYYRNFTMLAMIILCVWVILYPHVYMKVTQGMPTNFEDDCINDASSVSHIAAKDRGLKWMMLITRFVVGILIIIPSVLAKKM